MDVTVLVVCLVLALATLVGGLVLSRRSNVNTLLTVDPERFPLRSNVRSLPPQSVTSDVPVVDPELLLNEKVWVMEGIHRGMYGHIRAGPVGGEYLVCFPAQGDQPNTSGWFDTKRIARNKSLTIEERDPPQSVSGIIPYGQAAGDYPDPEATYEEMEFGPSDWRP